MVVYVSLKIISMKTALTINIIKLLKIFITL